jgi:P-type E1-E2 ATPase
MVRRAQEEKSPFIRLADRYSTVFTILTAIISVAAYFISHDINRVLAVLVVATPCPLILATPIALFGGMNSAAKKRILIKKISSLEVLSRCSAVVLDKTGTITLGQPEVTRVNIFDKKLSEREVYSIAEAIERNSLHPLAKAIIAKANEVGAKHLPVQKVSEKIGLGISAFINGKTYTLAKMGKYHHSNAIELHEEENLVAIFEFEDKLKTDSSNIISELKRLGLELYIFTGDRDENARKILEKLGKETSSGIIVRAGFSPEDKKNGIQELKKNKRIVGMIGDGINDAPALAIADVGMVFSNEEQTAASEAADVVFLGGSLSSITFIINNAKKTIRIALESILFGISLSIAAMIFAAIGYIPPLFGAILQEIIDIIVIINALRASK